jgi:hypothetical protein
MKRLFSAIKKQKAHLTGAQKREEVLASKQSHSSSLFRLSKASTTMSCNFIVICKNTDLYQKYKL